MTADLDHGAGQEIRSRTLWIKWMATLPIGDRLGEMRPRTPWIGDRFGGLLIVGESHYVGEGEIDNSHLTIQVIEDAIRGTSHRFHKNLAHAVTGRRLAGADFWRTVAFVNFCPGLVDGPRMLPTREMWAAGHDHFLVLLNEISPTHVLVLGKSKGRTFDNLPPFSAERAPILFEGQPRAAGYYELRSRPRAIVTSITHPSAAFSAERWHPFITEFLSIRD